MSDFTVIDMYPGEYFRVEADFRSEARRLKTNIVSASWESDTTSAVTVSAPSMVGNIASALLTAGSEGCALVKVSGVTTGSTQNVFDYVEVKVSKAVKSSNCS